MNSVDTKSSRSVPARTITSVASLLNLGVPKVAWRSALLLHVRVMNEVDCLQHNSLRLHPNRDPTKEALIGMNLSRPASNHMKVM